MTRKEGRISERLARAGITEREAEVLWAVTEWRRNPEIAARLHVSVRTVESHVAALMRKLGVTDRTALIEAGVHVRRTARTDTTLPTPLTRLIGRQTETDELVALLGAHRLVTLIGPGGVGKTRLALRVASLGVDGLADGIRVADLAPVGVELVGDAFARALGVVPEPGWSQREIMREVAATTACVLLVDNCEHVIAEAADIVADLLSADGKLRVLATSREPLGVPGEVSYLVQTLDVPAPPGGTVRAETIADFDAVRLFVDRAAAASAGFLLTDTIAAAVAALCRGLDGLPLAIELAASRMRTFGPSELVEHLDQRFELLSAGARTVRPQHRTLRGAIDWSYDLLDGDERALFDRLGVFPADFDYQAVESVCRSEDLGGASVMTVLPRLVDKSLVATVGGGTRRYRLLETIRSYATQRLAASDAQPAARQRHAAHYLALAEDAAQRLRTVEQGSWLDRLAMEQPNLRAALAYSTGAGDIEAALRWIAALERFWDMTGQLHEAREWIQRTLTIGEPPATRTAVAGLAAASMILSTLRSATALDPARRAAQLAAGLDDLSRARAALAIGYTAKPDDARPALLQALAGLGEDHPWERALTMQWLSRNSDAHSEAIQWGRDSAAMFLRVGDHALASNTLSVMAMTSLQAGIANDEVHQWLTQCQALAQAAGTQQEIAHATVGFATFAWVRGDHDRSAELMLACLPTLRRLGDLRCISRAVFMLGDHARVTGQLARAEELLRTSVESLATGPSTELAWALHALAAVFSEQGRPHSAAVVLGTAHHTRTSFFGPGQPSRDELHRLLVRALGASAFDDAHRRGENLTPIDVLRLAPLDESDNDSGPPPQATRGSGVGSRRVDG
jgi:predicted ATPase/DNA-binding CsgD family transcriptional regulator